MPTLFYSKKLRYLHLSFGINRKCFITRWRLIQRNSTHFIEYLFAGFQSARQKKSNLHFGRKKVIYTRKPLDLRRSGGKSRFLWRSQPGIYITAKQIYNTHRELSRAQWLMFETMLGRAAAAAARRRELITRKPLCSAAGAPGRQTPELDRTSRTRSARYSKGRAH